MPAHPAPWPIAATSQSYACGAHESARFREANEMAQSLQLSGKNSTSRRRDAKLASSFGVTEAAWTHDLEERFCMESPDMPVQVPGFDVDPPTRVVENRLADPIAMQRLLGHHREHEELEWPKRKEVGGTNRRRHGWSRLGQVLSF